MAGIQSDILERQNISGESSILFYFSLASSSVGSSAKLLIWMSQVQSLSSQLFEIGKYIKKVGEFMSEVYMKYSDFLNSITDEVSFELMTDVILTLKYDENNEEVIMSMKDKITANVELHGGLDLDRLNTLIKTLTIIRNQIKESKKGET